MGAIAERNQWFKEKNKVLDEFSGSHRTLMSTIAGRNFTKAPGYLYEASIMLEEAGKNKLSVLNYQIVAEAIERELKQTGHDYTQAYKAARIVFELEKQTLLTALQQELADLDATQSLKKEELDRLFVELDIRRIILITTKTAIELEMEGLKQELVDIDRLTFTNEALLINEKVNTATAKLAVIPYLEALIESQGKLLAAEEANIPYMEDLIGEKELLIDKKEETLPYLSLKANALEELSDAIIRSIPIEAAILEEKIAQVVARSSLIDGRINIINAETAVASLRELLATARLYLSAAKINRQASVAAARGIDTSTIATGHSAMITTLSTDDATIASGHTTTDASVAEKRMTGQSDAVDLTTTADKTAISAVASQTAARMKQVASTQAIANITSELIHLIGS